MRDVKKPAAAWTTATGNIPKKTTPNHNAEEVNLQLLASILQSGESVQIAPGLWFTIPSPVQFDPHPAPEGWQEEFGQAHVHPRTGEIAFHRAFFEGPDTSLANAGEQRGVDCTLRRLEGLPPPASQPDHSCVPGQPVPYTRGNARYQPGTVKGRLEETGHLWNFRGSRSTLTSSIPNYN
jgi:hypothetical protein